jgi:hypothetical protein
VNKDATPRRFSFALDTRAPLQLVAPASVAAAPEEVLSVPVTVRAAPARCAAAPTCSSRCATWNRALVVSEKSRPSTRRVRNEDAALVGAGAGPGDRHPAAHHRRRHLGRYCS